MSIFRSHILVPIDESTLQAGAAGVKRQLQEHLDTNGLSHEVKVLESGTMGLIDKGVILVIYPDNIHYYNVTPADTKRIVEQHIIRGEIAAGLDHAEASKVVGPMAYQTLGLTRKQQRVVLDRCWKIDPENIDEAIAEGAYKALEEIFSQSISADEVIEELKLSHLRGRGGSGFPTGLKWEFTRQSRSDEKNDEKYVICNADEGEPGTFKDRLILEGDPHKLVEAMIIAGYAIGASKGYVYIRGDYKLSIQRMEKAIRRALDYNLLGNNILNKKFDFHLEIKTGAGAYVCGEETALIQSMEGKRGYPQVKPPYPMTNGLKGKPTSINNVETLSNIPAIILNGADWFRSMGTDKSAGTKVFTVLGNVEQPGLIEVEMGTPLREIIFAYGGGIKDGKQFKAALVGGSAGVFLPERLLDVNMDFESLRENQAVLGSGSILVMDEDTSIPEMLFSVLKFFAHESCGQCAPCRIGTRQLVNAAYRVKEGQTVKSGRASEKDIRLMLSTAETIHHTSLCPLGQSVLLPVKSALKNFKPEFLQFIESIETNQTNIKSKYKEES